LNAARSRLHPEGHTNGREGWLRAAVLGADDGLVSTASLMIGVAATSASKSAVIIVGLAGLVAGAMSMAAGEYVSVSSQRDTEKANIAQEKQELKSSPEDELEELSLLYQNRGLEPALAKEVARQLSHHDVLEAHMRDELGMNEATQAHPFQAAAVSAASFSLAALLPIMALLVAYPTQRSPTIAITTLVGLGLMGALGGQLAKAPVMHSALRVLLGGGLAMGISALVGQLMRVGGI
jgi:VIT1/CCC1 family predicted Fe2+/Mn2+ transporter